MNWLTHNLIADMPGPLFLFFYALIVAFTLAYCYLRRLRSDWTGKLPAPHVPQEPDPYQLAYLRGGENEVARTVIFRLLQQDLLKLNQSGAQPVIERPRSGGAEPARQQMPVIERRTYDWFDSPRRADEIFQADGLAAQLKPFCSVYERQLQQENLLTSPQMRASVRRARLVGLFNVLTLSGYKIAVALAKGRWNVTFLVILTIVAALAVVTVCRLPRVSRRGVKYLEQLRVAFAGLRDRSQKAAQYATTRAAAVDPVFPLLVGVFGVGALAGTPYDDYQQTFRRAAQQGDASSASGCGSSCGSSCSSGGSCGGGGCGGGGCGGCS